MTGITFPGEIVPLANDWSAGVLPTQLQRGATSSDPDGERRYRELVQALPAAIYLCDAAGRLTFFNDAAEALWGRAPKIGDEVWCEALRLYRLDGSPMPRSECPVAVAMEERRAIDAEALIERPDGTRRHVVARPRPMLDANGELRGVVNMLVDVTGRKAAERELAETRDDLSAQVAALTQLHRLATMLAVPIELEPALRAILQTLVDFHAARGGRLTVFDRGSGAQRPDVVAGEQGEKLKALSCARVALSSGVAVTTQRIVIEDVETDPRCDNDRDLARSLGIRAVHGTPIATAFGRILGDITVYFDVPRAPTEREMQFADMCALHAAQALEREEAGCALRESDQRFRILADTAPAVLWTSGPDAACRFVSRGFYDFTGMPPQSGLANGWMDAVHPDDRARAAFATSRANARRQPFSIDLRLRHRNNGYRWVNIVGRVRQRGDDYQGHIGAISDIHDRKLAEDALYETNVRLDATRRQLATITETMPAAVAHFSRDGRYLWANPNYATRFNHTPQELVGQTAETVLGSEAWRIKKPYVDRVLAGERVEFEALIPTPGVGRRWYHSAYSPTYDEDSMSADGWVAVITDITRHKELQAALEEAARRKDEFLAVLAHELRNPLAPIRNALEIMQMAGSNARAQADARDVIVRQLKQMVRLVDDLLDVSRISRGKISLHRERVPLRDVLESAVETSRPLIDAAHHRFRVSLPDEQSQVHADVTRMAQVFSNLLNNAAKYTAPGGEIALSTVRQGNSIEVAVSDNGIGIPRDMIGRVFEIFTQVGQPLEGARSGLGIGLSIAKRLVEMHGGSISARSDGPGKGSVFTVTLPLCEVGKAGSVVCSDESLENGTEPRRVLVADDNVDAADTLAVLLEMMGNEVRTAHDGVEALEIAREFHPEIILLDVGMPRMTGHEACQRIRQEPWARGAVIAALTGWGQDVDRRKSQAAGFDHHLVKPIDIAALQRLFEPETH